jgi:hypothetical protein
VARFFWLYSTTLRHRQDRLAGSDRRVDDVSTPSVLPNLETRRLDVTPTGGRGNLGSFARLSFMIRVADSP